MKRSKTTSLLRYENHICWTADINKFLKKFRCYVCDQFFDRSFNLLRHMQNCSENTQHKYPTGAYQLSETIFERLEDVNINVPQELRLFSHLIVFDFESITVPDSTLKNTDLTSWIGKHVPISVSISSNLLSEPIFICNEDPLQLIRDFVSSLSSIAEKSTLLMREKLDDFVLVLEEKYWALRQLVPVKDKQVPTGAEDLFENEAEPEVEADEDLEIRRLRSELRVISKLRQDFENYYSTIPVFGFNSSRYDLNLIKEYLLHHLLLEKNVIPKVIRMGNKYIGMNFLGLQFLDILNFLGGATTLDNFLKAYGASEEKGFFPYEWFDSIEKLNVSQLPPIDSFWSKLKNHNVLSVDYDKFVELKNGGMEQDEILKKLRLKKVPQNAEENYLELQNIWERKGMQTFRDFLMWYNNKDVEPTLEAMKKMISFYHSRQVDMLKLGYTLPNLANRFLHSSTDAAFFPFCEKDKEYDNYIRKWLTGGPSIIFTRYAKVGETKIRESENVCKSIVGIDASQLYPFSMTKEMPTGPYTKWEYNEETEKFHPNRNWRSYFEQQVMDYFQQVHPNCKIQTQFTHKKQKKLGPYLVDGFCNHCNTVFEAMGCFFHFCPCQEEKPLLFEDIESGLKRRERDNDRREYLKGLGLNVEEIWECQWKKWRSENTNGVKDFLKSNYPFQPAMNKHSLIEKIKRGELFGVVDCRLEVPEEMYPYFEDFPPIFKNCEVGRDDIGDHMKEFAERNKLLSRPRKMLISSFKLERGPVITPLLLFYLEKGVILKDVFWFLQYTPRRCFETFVQNVVDARREGDQNRESTVVAETMKLIGNSSYGYQIMDRSRHTNTKYVKGSQVDKFINNRFFKTMNELPEQIYEVEMSKSRIDHKEPIIVGFFILQYAKLTMLQLKYNFFTPFCDKNKYELIEMDTDSLYMALSEEKIEDIIRPEMRSVWYWMRQSDCNDNFAANSSSNFFPRECCRKHAAFDKRTPGLFKEEFRCSEMIALCSKTYCCYDEETDTVKLSSKGLNKSNIEEPLNKYRKVLFNEERVYSTNRGFRVVDNKKVCTYELKKVGLSYFYPKRKVCEDGIHTTPLDL